MLNNIYTKILLVFICLYIFLVGISGLSKSIGGLTTPSELSIGDMAQLKKQTLTINGEEIKKKKIWVKITEIDTQKGQYTFEYSENDIKTIGQTTKKNIKKVASSNFINATSSRFISLFIGVFATVLFQSSSTTTSLIVGMAGGGLIGLSSAIPMVMGANIGTTVTNTLVSLGHIRRKEEFKRAFASSTVHDFFNMLAVIIFFPLEIMFGFL